MVTENMASAIPWEAVDEIVYRCAGAASRGTERSETSKIARRRRT